MIEGLDETSVISGAVWIVITLAIYSVALLLARLFNGHPLSHPLIFTSCSVALVLFISNTQVSQYQQSAYLLHWLLGPVTVALALPIYKQWKRLRTYGWRLIVSIVIGGVIAPLMAWGALWFFDAPVAMQFTMLAKSITTPLAMHAASQIGGIPPLAAVFVITTGIIGAICAGTIFSLCRIDDPNAQGIALGTVAHAVGTSKAIHLGEEVAAMATLGLCVNGIFTAFLLPILFQVVRAF